MKTTFLLFAGFLLFIAIGSAGSQNIQTPITGTKDGSMSIVCTSDLYELTSIWASIFCSLNPGVKIKVIKKEYSSADLGANESLCFLSNKATGAINNNSNWKLAIGRDVIVPVFNLANPFSNGVNKYGISQEKLTLILQNTGKRNWGTILANAQTEPVHLYMVNDEAVKNGIAAFIKSTKLQFEGIIMGTTAEILKAVQNDPYAIGFCKVSDIQNENNLAAGIQFLPVDKNGNGSIDYMENIYTDVNTFQRGVWIGKYPKALVSNIYAVSNIKPANENELAFLKWVLTDGQQYMKDYGFSDLASSENLSQLDKLTPATINVNKEKDSSSAGIVLLVIVIILGGGLVVGALVRNYRKQNVITPDFNVPVSGFASESVMLPKGLYFDKTHTWSFLEKNGSVTVGIDDFLQHITGPVTKVELRKAGDRIRKGDVLFTIIQFGKQLNIYAPFSGTIKAYNEALLADSSKLNSSPYDLGWVYTMEPSSWIKDMQLMDLADKYRRWIDAEFSRLKEFLSVILEPESVEYAHVVMQDGGELKEGVLTDFGPEVWEDFQSNFLDTFR